MYDYASAFRILALCNERIADDLIDFFHIKIAKDFFKCYIFCNQIMSFANAST